MQLIFCSCSHLHSTNFRTTWHPLLLGGQTRCGFKASSRLLHITNATEIKPQAPRSRVQRLNHSATRSKLYAYLLFYGRCMQNKQWGSNFISGTRPKFGILIFIYSLTEIQIDDMGWIFIYINTSILFGLVINR